LLQEEFLQPAVIVRIAAAVPGFVLFAVAATGARQAEALFADAKVFTLRIFGAIAIAAGRNGSRRRGVE